MSFAKVIEMNILKLSIIGHYSSLLHYMIDGVEDGGRVPAASVLRLVLHQDSARLSYGFFQAVLKPLDINARHFPIAPFGPRLQRESPPCLGNLDMVLPATDLTLEDEFIGHDGCLAAVTIRAVPGWQVQTPAFQHFKKMRYLSAHSHFSH